MSLIDLDEIFPKEGGDVKTWKRSSFCSLGDCVEVNHHPNGWVHVRDSKHPEQPALRFSRDEWQAFTAGVQAGEFGPQELG